MKGSFVRTQRVHSGELGRSCGQGTLQTDLSPMPSAIAHSLVSSCPNLSRQKTPFYSPMGLQGKAKTSKDDFMVKIKETQKQSCSPSLTVYPSATAREMYRVGCVTLTTGFGILI